MLSGVAATLAVASAGGFTTFAISLCLGDEPTELLVCQRLTTFQIVLWWGAAFIPAIVTATAGVISVMRLRGRLLAVTTVAMLLTGLVVPQILWSNLACHNGCA